MSLQPPPLPHSGRTGAGLWVLLALGLGIVYSLFSDSDVPATSFDWVLTAVITVIWVVAARNARSTIGKVILWLIVIGQAAFWVIVLGLFVSG